MSNGVSIIIPAYNAERTLRECIVAVQQQTWEGRIAQIVVVNDGSTDNTLKIAYTFPYPNVYTISVSNGGVAKATNLGIKNTAHDVVIRLDSDVILEPDWLSKIMPWFDDPKVGAVSGFVECGNKSLIGRIMGYHLELRLSRMPQYPWTLWGANTAYRRSVLDKIGLFDEKLRASEDVDISHRIREAGYLLVLEKQARCKHMSKDTLRGFIRQQYRAAYYGIVEYRKRESR